MNKQRMSVWRRRILTSLLVLLPGLPQSAFADAFTIPPVRSFPFDVSRGDSTLDVEIQIREYRNYHITLKFDYAGDEDLSRVLKLVGRSNETGVIIPIHLKVLRIDQGVSPKSIYEEDVETRSHSAHGFSEIKSHGNYHRMIAVIPLKPGLYRMHVNTTKESPEFVGTPSHFTIEWDARMRSLIEGGEH